MDIGRNAKLMDLFIRISPRVMQSEPTALVPAVIGSLVPGRGVEPTEGHSMSNDDKFEGKAKEIVGKVAGDDELESEGAAQHARGKVEEKVEKAKDTAKGVSEAAKDAVSDVSGDGDDQ